MRNSILAGILLAACSPANTHPFVDDAGPPDVDAYLQYSPPDLGTAPDLAEAVIHCATTDDCPNGYACWAQAGICATDCDLNHTCKGGCCDGAKCQPGTTTTVCGSGPGLCADCTDGSHGGSVCVPGPHGNYCGCENYTNSQCSTSPLGHRCRYDVCGCSGSGDCAAGQQCGSDFVCH